MNASVKTLDDMSLSLNEFGRAVDEFAEDVARIDSDVAALINRRKNEFYEENPRLKPESEKSWLEKAKEYLDSVAEWCAKNWSSIGKILLTAVAIVSLAVLAAMTGGILSVLLTGAYLGALTGALAGGISGAVIALLTGGNILQGFADGAFSGAVTGALTGLLGVAGGLVGGAIRCGSNLAKFVSGISRVTRILSIGMDGFDILAMGAGLFMPGNPLTALNTQLHASRTYNAFQRWVNALAVFTGAADKNMMCFVAGTAVLTAAGTVAIEKLKAGDFVTSTDPETFKTSDKMVTETYVRTAARLVRLAVAGEEIVTTPDHPFFVRGVGFVNARILMAGDYLSASNGFFVPVISVSMEDSAAPMPVYNLQVEDFHTYRVSGAGILVHNADYPKNPKDLEKQGYTNTTDEHLERTGRSVEYTNLETGDRLRFDYANPGSNGYGGKDHYHHYNPNATGDIDMYLDIDGNPCRRGSGKSHILLD